MSVEFLGGLLGQSMLPLPFKSSTNITDANSLISGASGFNLLFFTTSIDNIPSVTDDTYGVRFYIFTAVYANYHSFQLLFDHNGDIYSRYLRGSQSQTAWKKIKLEAIS